MTPTLETSIDASDLEDTLRETISDQLAQHIREVEGIDPGYLSFATTVWYDDNNED